MRLCWPWQGKGDCEVEPRLERAEGHLADLKVRADRAAESLIARDRRNHWGETVAAIARREVRENGV